MNRFLLLFFIACVFSYEKDGHVLILTDSNFDLALKEFPYILVEFYAQWCTHCKQLAPDYERAASMLSDVVLAKVDAEQNRQLASRFEIRGNGKARPYDGKRSAEEIINWVKDYAVPVLTFINSKEELENFKKNLRLVLVYYANSEKQELDQVLFESQADYYDGVYFGVAQGLKSQHKIVLHTPYQEESIPFTSDINRDTIKEFIMSKSFPLVFSYRKREQDLIEKKYQPTVILFLDNEVENTEEEKILRQVAEKRRGEIHFTKLNKKDSVDRSTFYRNKFDYRFGVKKFPTVLIYDTASPLKDKFKLEGSISVESLEKFIDQWKSQELEPYYKSQPIPPINDGVVKVIVGKSYQNEVINSQKPFLLFFHDPYNSQSKNFVGQFFSAAESNSYQVNFGMIDYVKNEVGGMYISSFPAVKLYRKVDGKLKLVDYRGDWTSQGIINFLNEYFGKGDL